MRLFLGALLLLFLQSYPAYAENKYDGSIKIVVPNLPKFEDWPAEEAPEKIAEDIDWNSHKNAWGFRTRLREGLKNGPNFGGKYILVTHGCGTSCQGNWVIDAETGKVVGNFGTFYGVAYRKDSRLLIANLPASESGSEIDADALSWGPMPVRFYVVSDGYLDLFHSLSLCSSLGDACAKNKSATNE